MTTQNHIMRGCGDVEATRTKGLVESASMMDYSKMHSNGREGGQCQWTKTTMIELIRMAHCSASTLESGRSNERCGNVAHR